MNHTLSNFWAKLQALAARDEGQDLVEYALVVGLISVAAVGALNNVAGAVNAVITNITNTLNGAV